MSESECVCVGGGRVGMGKVQRWTEMGLEITQASGFAKVARRQLVKPGCQMASTKRMY